MSDLEANVLGTCLQMCPESERNLRTKNKIVHSLEKPNSENGKNEYMLVKSFSRSAAGNMSFCDPKEIRPPYICRRTTNYLIENILFRHSENHDLSDLKFDMITYHFVFDRLRALRQDMVVQKIGVYDVDGDHKDIIIHTHILQVCIKFHLLANYLHCKTNMESSTGPKSSINTQFDPHINFSHLLECLKMILNCFEILYPRKRDKDRSKTTLSFVEHKSLTRNYTRMNMIAVYLLLNIGSYHSYRWGLELDYDVKNNNIVAQALKMNKLYLEKNYVGLFKEVRRLPTIPLLAFHWNLPFVFKELLTVMNMAYSSQNCMFPLQRFAALYALEGVNEKNIIKYLEEHNIRTYTSDSTVATSTYSSKDSENSTFICFNKNHFNASSNVNWQQLPSLDKKLTSGNLLSLFLDYDLNC